MKKSTANSPYAKFYLALITRMNYLETAIAQSLSSATPDVEAVGRNSLAMSGECDELAGILFFMDKLVKSYPYLVEYVRLTSITEERSWLASESLLTEAREMRQSIESTKQQWKEWLQQPAQRPLWQRLKGLKSALETEQSWLKEEEVVEMNFLDEVTWHRWEQNFGFDVAFDLYKNEQSSISQKFKGLCKTALEDSKVEKKTLRDELLLRWRKEQEQKQKLTQDVPESESGQDSLDPHAVCAVEGWIDSPTQNDPEVSLIVHAPYAPSLFDGAF